MARRVREQTAQAHRMGHIVRVARLSGRLARAHGIDPGPARIAGLLHDLARLFPAERLLEESARRGLPIGPFERANPIVLHAALGAELAREEFGITDAGVLSAIRKHTVADAVMSPLDSVVYLADGLEPGRVFPGRAELAALAFRDLDAALGGLLASTLAYLAQRGLTAAPQTRAAAQRYGIDPATVSAPVSSKEHCSA
jgi:predicted HD superfamily hydrolase involved in NAD metabolism